MDNKPIGIYDSGVGGVAVLRTIQNLLPNEKYILFADFKNAPYGKKTKKEILRLARGGVKLLLDKDVKAVVVACNTATSAAIKDLRAEYEIPIIGMEPAVKPAAESVKSGKIIVLASPATLRLMKFHKLSESLGGKNIQPVECPGLSMLIEKEKPGSQKIKDYLEDILSQYKKEEIAAAVIGCTHYSFIEPDIKKTTGCSVVFDGRHGTAKHLKKILEEKTLLGTNTLDTQFVITGEKAKYHKLLLEFMLRPLGFED